MVADSFITFQSVTLRSSTLQSSKLRSTTLRSGNLNGGRRAIFILAIAVASLLLPSSAVCAQLAVFPDKLELTGQDPIHGVVVSLTDDQGEVTDVSNRVTFEVDKPGLVAIGHHGVIEAQSAGEATLIVKLDEMSISVPITVTNFDTKHPPSFMQDVLPILTRSGCNTGACHGKLSGQNGFRLSLRGYAPEWDHDWIAKEVSGRRVDFGFPEESLLLTKPSGGVAHEGGVRFRPESRMWRTLRDWVAARAPAPLANEPDVTRLEVLPGNLSMTLDQTQQLLVRAHYTDGRVRDVTWLAQFFSNDPNKVSVNSNDW